jgi:DNA-binding transcriptional LysR family regulator
VFPNVEVRHLHAVVVLAEEMNFTRAAHRLNVTQPALSKQITELEKHYRLRLFNREKGRLLELTEPGRVFVQEARASLLHAERAIQLARTVHEDSESVLIMGRSPDANQNWISAILAIRLPLYPNLRIRLATRFEMDLVRSVISGELNFALVTAPPKNTQITAVPFVREPLHAVLPEDHPAAAKERLSLRDLAGDEWILFAEQVHPIVHNVILETARREKIDPKEAHATFTGREAAHLVSEHLGVAIVTGPAALDLKDKGLVLRPLCDKSLCFDTCLVMRRDDNSRAVNDVARMFLKKFAPQHRLTIQMQLPLPA